MLKLIILLKELVGGLFSINTDAGQLTDVVTMRCRLSVSVRIVLSFSIWVLIPNGKLWTHGV